VYDISISTLDELSINLQTETVEEALSAFKPAVIKDKVIINTTHLSTGRKNEKQLFAPRARFTFNNETAIKILARNIERALK
jgi:hypothetical protein